MKKFKVKNRQKRKYTKRTPEPVQTAPFFHPTLSNIFPSIVLTLGLLITVIVSIPTNQLEHIHFSAPSLSLSSAQQNIENLKHLSFPTIAFPMLSSPKLSLPNISLPDTKKPIRQASTQIGSAMSQTSRSLQTFFQIILSILWNGGVLLVSGIKYVTSIVLNTLQITLRLTVQLMSVLNRITLTSLNFFHQGILTSVARIVYAYQLGFELSIQLAQIIWKGLTALTNLIFSVIEIYVATLIHRSINVFTWLSATITLLFTIIIHFITLTVQTILAWLAALGNLIAQPFIYLYKQFMKLKPIYDFASKNFAQASGVLGQGTKNLIELPESFKK